MVKLYPNPHSFCSLSKNIYYIYHLNASDAQWNTITVKQIGAGAFFVW